MKCRNFLKNSGVILLLFFVSPLFAQDTTIIYSSAVSEEDYRYETTLKDYQEGEDWTIWSLPMGKAKASSELVSEGKTDYKIANLSDSDLKTAWVEGDSLYGIGEKIEFTINYPEHASYGTAYQFYGVVNLFNGYCKSMNHWKENSRVKTLKVYYNDQFLCLVRLVDTWHFQTFDLARFFKNIYMRKYMNASLIMKSGDKLTFEISEVYPGSKYKDTAISEFLIEGAKN